MSNLEYFFLAEDVKRNTAFAYTEDETPLSHELIPKMRSLSLIPFHLQLKKVMVLEGKTIAINDTSGLKNLWLDYQPNNLAWPLMSKKMKEIIEGATTGHEGIKWMEVTVKNDEIEKRPYFIPRFESKLDVLDENKTTYITGTKRIVRPVFSAKKIMRYAMFHKPGDYWEITSGLYINSDLKNALSTGHLTGLKFEKITVSD